MWGWQAAGPRLPVAAELHKQGANLLTSHITTPRLQRQGVAGRAGKLVRAQQGKLGQAQRQGRRSARAGLMEQLGLQPTASWCCQRWCCLYLHFPHTHL